MTATYPNSTLWLTGHSLGGSLASLVGLTFGVPTVTFEAPPERLASQRLHLPSPPGMEPQDMNIWHFGHTADPVYMGICTVLSLFIRVFVALFCIVCFFGGRLTVGANESVLVWRICFGVDLSYGNGMCI